MVKTSKEILNELKRLQEKIASSKDELVITDEFQKISEKFKKYYSGEEEITIEEIQELLPEYEKTIKLLEEEKKKILTEIEKVKREKKMINSYLANGFQVEGIFLDKKR
ncbi:hypothetical protein [Carboxydothermus hydrogenoformans]|uniref:Flagellar protein FliT n=1 Tax=Carboxydothermus hydrogenoformans (strain ATCC BAA-161 / DSM 6008 / Z-2901) TaxID=246194 RepID=Q3ADF0_CARHZ|nr:hypothetical protein [Carboxydothermus hydrogenoformans]ABB15815.1 hypothetical protein CHY_0987 [Carboxydothermus hydrogenoformans Z-2901]